MGQASLLRENEMNRSEAEKLQSCLRKLFDSQRIRVVLPSRKGLSAELALNDETIGTIHKDVDDGETSYSIHLTVLEEDLL